MVVLSNKAKHAQRLQRVKDFKLTGEPGDWFKKWHNLYRNSYLRKAEFSLTFDQYLKLAVKAGLRHPSQIGRDSDQYQMGRFADSGGYEWGNCRFITARTNQREKLLNGGVARAIAKTSAKLRGRSAKTHEYIARTAELRRGRTKKNDESVARAGRRQSATKKRLKTRSNPERVWNVKVCI